MTTVEVAPGTLLIAATYVHTLEDRLRNADERAEQSELQLLLVREEARQTCERAAELHEQAVEHLRAEVPVDDTSGATRDEMTWRKRFFVSWGCALIIGILLLVLNRYWDQLPEWLR